MKKGIDQDVIDEARALAATRLEKETTFPDSEVSGLGVRIKGSKAYWHLRAKPNKIDLGELDAFRADQIDLVRQLATRVKALWKSGRKNDEIKVLINSIVAQWGTAAPSMETAENDLAVAIDGAWTWEVLRREYLKWCKVYKSDATYNTYHSALGAAKNSKYIADMRHLERKAIANISQLDILALRNNILERGGMVDGVPVGNIRTAEQVENGLRAAFKFAMDPRRKSGLKLNPMVGLPSVDQPDLKKRDIVDADDIFETSVMTLKQIFDLLDWVPAQGYEPEAVHALTLQALTGQRIETATSTFHNQTMRTLTSSRYRYIWYLGPDKSRRYRALPLPKWASWVAHHSLLRYRERAGEEEHRNNFLYRQLRARRAGGPRDGHITNHLINNIYNAARLPGGPLEGTKFASHDVRKAFVTHLGKKGKLLGLPYDNCVKDLQRITHKGEGKATVIEKYYDLDGDEQWRLRVLELWEYMILGANGEKNRWDDRMLDLPYDPAEQGTQEEWTEMMSQAHEEVPDDSEYA